MLLPLDIALAVLLAALLHAGWSALAKRAGQPALDLALIFTGGGVLSLALLPFGPMPAAESWPWLAASVLIHGAYVAAMALTYRIGELSHVYPLMRGAPLLIVAGLGTVLVGETVGLQAWAGIALISGGILSLGLGGRVTGRASALALLTASTTAAYTIVDGIGVRLSGAPAGYILWLFLLTAPAALASALVLDGPALPAHLRRHWRRGLVGGGASLLAYGIVLWAMTRAPIALVAALRETSIVFAVMLGALWLGEPVDRRRAAAALAIAAGAVVLKLA